jgi:hypothetical protein
MTPTSIVLCPTSGQIGILPPLGMMRQMTTLISFISYETYCELIRTTAYQKVNDILYFIKYFSGNILSHDRATIDGVWIGNWNY